MAARVLFPFVVRGIFILCILALIALVGLWSLRSWVYQQLEDAGIHSVQYQIERIGVRHIQLADISLVYTDADLSIPVTAEQIQLHWSWTRDRLTPVPHLLSLDVQHPHITLPSALFAGSEQTPPDTVAAALPDVLQDKNWMQPLQQISDRLDHFDGAHFKHTQITLLPDNSSDTLFHLYMSVTLERVDASSLQIDLHVPEQTHLPALNSSHVIRWHWHQDKDAMVNSKHRVTVHHLTHSFQGHIQLDAHYANERDGAVDSLDFQVQSALNAAPLQYAMAAFAARYSQITPLNALIQALPTQANSELIVASQGNIRAQSSLAQWPMALHGELALTLTNSPVGTFAVETQIDPALAKNDSANSELRGDIVITQPSQKPLTLAQLRQKWHWFAETVPPFLPTTDPEVREEHIQLPNVMQANWRLHWSHQQQQWTGLLQASGTDSMRVTIPDYASSTLDLKAQAILTEEQLDDVRLDLSGLLFDLDYLRLQENLNWSFPELAWTFVLSNNAPIQLSNALSEPSQWYGRFHTHSQVRANSPHEFSMELPFQITLNPHSEHEPDSTPEGFRIDEVGIALRWRQARMDIDESFSVRSPQLELDGVIQPHNSQWQLRLTKPLRLNGEFVYTTDAEHALRTQFQFQYQSDAILWGEQGIVTEGRSELNLPHLVYEPLIPQQWRWQADTRFASDPLRITLERGELTSSHGLRLHHQGVIDPSSLVIDWNITDIFFIAGNPIARAWGEWPELLQLQRGRMTASGRLTNDFSAHQPSWLVESSIQFMDAVGIYDTTSFGGLNGDIQLRIEPEQIHAHSPNLRVLRINQGIDFGPFLLRGGYQASNQQLEAMASADNILPHGTVTIDESALGLFGGIARVQSGTYELSGSPFILPIELHELDLNQLLTQYPAPDLTGTGRFSGMLPLRFSEQGISIHRGTVAAIPPGGVLNYRSERATAIGRTNPAMRILTDAFDHFEYEHLDGEVMYQEDGALELVLRLRGQNPQLPGSRPIHLNLSLQENLPALITGLQLSNRVNEIIHQRVQQKFLETVR